MLYRSSSRHLFYKAIAIPLVVALILFSAAILLSIVYGVINTEQVNNVIATQAQAESAIAQSESLFQGELNVNPFFFLYETFPAEQDRVCLTGATTTPIVGGSPWPTACGNTWNYSPNTNPAAVTLEITPPTPNSPYLVAVFTAHSTSFNTIKKYNFLYNKNSLTTVYSNENLDLNSLSQGGGLTTIDGPVYSSGYISLPTSNNISLQNTELEAESGFTTTPSDSSTLYYTANTAGSSVLRPISQVAPSPYTPASLETSVDRDATMACQPTATNLSSGYLSSLCLERGTFLVNTSGNQTAIPTNTAAYMITFGGTSSSTINIYESTVNTYPAGQCSIFCASNTLTNNEATSGSTNPLALLSHWTFVGTFNYPATGIIATDAPTYIGYCGSNFDIANTSCSTISGANPGMVVTQPITVIAGSTSSPQNIYIDSPINLTGSNDNLGLVATNNIVLTSWATPPGSQLTIDAGLMALGLGDPVNTPSFIQNTPNPAPPIAGSAPNYLGGPLVIKGVLISPNLDISSINSYEKISFTADPAFTASPPPYWPGFDNTWFPVSSTTSN
jgi:hypothetical protein